MEKIQLKAYAKINLTLNVLNKREDGYHNLESVFQPISLYDEVFIEKTNDNNMEFKCNIPTLQNSSNIIVKAYNKLKEIYFEKISGIKVHLIKNIPSEAGMRWRKQRLC